MRISDKLISNKSNIMSQSNQTNAPGISENKTEGEGENERLPVDLHDYQVDHVRKIIDTFASRKYVIDTSIMGAGKTYTSCAVAKVCNFPNVLVICPTSVIPKWKELLELFDIPSNVTSYESYRGTKRAQPKHGLLKRENDKFIPQGSLQEMAEKGVLLVIDEFHRAKNESDQYESLRATCKVLMNSKLSRILLLSGTPFDKEGQPIHMMQMLNVIESDHLIAKEGQTLVLTGAKEFIDYCETLDLQKTRQIVKTMPLNRKALVNLCLYKLYIDVVHNKITHAMYLPQDQSKVFCYNAYFDLDAESEKSLTEAIKSLNQATRFNPDTLDVDAGQKNLGAITKALASIQTSKARTMARVANSILQKYENVRVCIYYDFNGPIELTYQLLKEYNPLRITGEVKPTERSEIVKRFQENKEDRLLILNSAVGSEGIDLDDTDGKYPRFVLYSPNYHIMRIHQMTRRFMRAQTKSPTIICMVYANGKEIETSILNALVRKSEVFKESLQEQVDAGVVFPSCYPSICEKDGCMYEIEENTREVHRIIDIRSTKKTTPVKSEKREVVADATERKQGEFDAASIFNIANRKLTKVKQCTLRDLLTKLDFDKEIENAHVRCLKIS
jgi:superfamily II DNA or RNA helicase